MNIAEFYANNLQTKFIDRMCALLGITDFSRVKIVGIYSGSVVVNATIDSPQTSLDQSGNSTTARQNQQAMIALDQKLAQLYSSGQVQSTLSQAGFGKIITYNQQIATVTDISTSNNKSSLNVTAIIAGSVIGFVIVVVIVFGVIMFVIRKRARIAMINQNEFVKV